MGIRVPMLSVVILTVDLLAAVGLSQLIKNFLPSEIYAYIIAAVPALIIAAIVVIITIKFSRMSRLPMVLQIQTLRENARQPDVFNFSYVPEED